MKNSYNMKKHRFLLLALIVLIMGGASPAWAETLTANFNSGLPDGWSIVGDLSRNSDRARSGSGVWSSSKSDNANYLITEDVEGSITFYARAYNKSTNAYVIIYEYDGSTLGNELYRTSNMKTSSTPTWSSYTANLSGYTGQVAIALNYAAIDDVTYTQHEAVSGPALAVKDGSAKLTSPYSYNFGLTTSGTTHSFTLSNPGTTDLGVSVSETGDFSATLSANTIAAGGEVTLTITMPNTTSSSTVTITPATGSGIDPFVLNVSGTVRDANKVYLDFADGQMPEGWTSVAIGSYTSDTYAWKASTGYVSTSASSSYYVQAFTSPQLTFAKDELIFFETSKYGSSSYYTPSVIVEYSIDGSTWTAIGSAFTDDVYGTWTSRMVTIPVEGVKFIRFNGWYVNLRNIYGGEESNAPNMKVTQPASLDFGAITSATDKTFTIANTGKATLEGINVTSSNPLFTISNAPTSLAAGASQDVTITMAATTTGALSSDITVSATDMENVQFTVTGVVLPDGMFVVDFNDNQLPAGWTNASWTFTNGEATGKSYSAYLTTPKLQFASGDMLVIKAKRYDSDATDYLTVQGSSDNGATWTAYSKKLQNTDGLTYPDYGTMILTDIPTTVNKLRFVGYYVVVDEIAGLTYAPVLAVTRNAITVSSPENHDFGEIAADANVTYNFANSGAGTINITNVAITGDGAAAYSTNWTASVAAPFDLVITRNYDATRAGTAQNAVVTVTTSEGDFVINVTGTDKAANAPEIAVDQTSLDFGKLTANSTITVTVTNAGTGSMDVAIASDNELFTLSATALTGIGAGESQTFDVTFNYANVAGNYGTKSANITVTPSYDATAFVTIAATAKAADPNVWTEDFSANTVPTGWIAENNWTVADGAAKASYAYGTTTYLTTPTLTVSNASDELTFDYKATANYVSIKIQMSKDGAAFADYNTISGLNNGNAGTYTITGLEAGEYQFRFANDDYELDNFEGFKLNMADHLLSFTATSIPATGNQYVEYTATATVKELAGKDEELTAKFFIGGTQYGGNVVKTVSANGTETFTVTFTPDAAVSGDAYFTVSNDDVSLESDKTAVTIAEALVLDETVAATLTDGNAPIVVVKYTAKTGWNTITMPFNLSNDDLTAIFGTGWKAYELKGFDGTSSLEFKESTQFYAGYAYIVNSVEPANNTLYKQNVTIVANPKNDSYNGATFYGTYAPMAAGTMTGKYGVTTEGRIAKGSASATMKGFRGYLELPDNVSNVRIMLPGGEILTGINTMDNGQLSMDNEAYDLQGRRVQNAKKGFFIINGKKVVK